MTKCYYKKVEDGIEYEMWGHPPNASKDQPDRVVALKRWLYVFCHNIIKIHNWKVVKDTGITKYYKCKHCGRKQVRQKLGGYQPIDWKFLGYDQTPQPPRSFYIIGQYAIYTQWQKQV
jgi:hypothetical protein